MNVCLTMIHEAKRPSAMWFFACQWFHPLSTNARQLPGKPKAWRVRSITIYLTSYRVRIWYKVVYGRSPTQIETHVCQMQKFVTSSGAGGIVIYLFKERPTIARVWHKAVFKWVQAEDRSPDTPLHSPEETLQAPAYKPSLTQVG